MAMDATLQIRIDSAVKEQVEALYDMYPEFWTHEKLN